MSIYDEGRAAAIRLLAPLGTNPDAAGQVVTFDFTPPGTYIPGGSVIPGAPVNQTCSGVEKSIRAERIDGANILHGDIEFVMSPVTIAGADLQLPPITNGQLPADAILTLSDGRPWRVVSVDAKRPSGLLISATLQLRL